VAISVSEYLARLAVKLSLRKVFLDTHKLVRFVHNNRYLPTDLAVPLRCKHFWNAQEYGC
jgi:hypothetical protein